jgi:hypothetical protein
MILNYFPLDGESTAKSYLKILSIILYDFSIAKLESTLSGAVLPKTLEKSLLTEQLLFPPFFFILAKIITYLF